MVQPRMEKTESKAVSETILSLRNVTKIFGRDLREAKKLLAGGAEKDLIFRMTSATIGAHDISLDIAEGEIFVIIGLSGSGKSTLVRCLNMLHRPTAGNIFFKGKDVVAFSRKELIDFRRNRIAMVFQNFGLLSHRNVLDNVAFGLEIRGIEKKKRYISAFAAIDLVGLSGQEYSGIHTLSGGMKQRVGLARALASDPDILLMDEPFSALDPIVRRNMQAELLKIQKKVRKTIIFITHDINEAFKLGDKIAIMRDGDLIQAGTPETILYDPADDYVRDFVRDIDKGKALCAWHVLEALPAGSNPVTPDITIWIDTPLQDVIPLLKDGNLEGCIGILDADGVLVGVTSGVKVLTALS